MDLIQGILTIFAIVVSSSLVKPQWAYVPSQSAAFASSSSYPGVRPVAYTATTGGGHAVASAGSYQTNGQYLQLVSGSRVRRAVERTDETQQRGQAEPPVGLFGLSQIPSEHLQPAFPPTNGPVTSSSLTVSDKLGASAFAEAQPSPPKETTTFTQSQASSGAESLQGGNRFESAPASVYGPPVKGSQNVAGSLAQAQALANQGEKAPAREYGLPGVESGSLSTADSSSPERGSPLVLQKPHKAYGVPHIGSQLSPQFSPSAEFDREFVFVPAFPNQERPGHGAELAPPTGGFVPPDGALLSPSAPVINNVPIPSPRFPSRLR